MGPNTATCSLPKTTSLNSICDYPVIPLTVKKVDDSDHGSTSAAQQARGEDVSSAENLYAKEDMILNKVIKDHNVHLGGSSIGRGFRRAARYYLRQKAPQLAGEITKEIQHLEMDDLLPGVMPRVEEPFYVCDLGAVVAQYYQWKKHFPRVEPFYAVKCNPDRAIVKTLARLGANFDCASRNEINLVLGASRELGLEKTPEIIFANPCKPRTHIIEAVCKGVRMMTFDNVDEVEKCAKISKKIELILRIITDDSGSQCRLSSKFGAPKARWRVLLAAAKRHGLAVVGVSFHVGSGCRDSSRYDLALKDAKELFEMAERDYGFEMKILDIGGGFPGETHSLWNPVDIIDPTVKRINGEMVETVIDDQLDDVAEAEDDDDKKEGLEKDFEEDESKPLMFFQDIADHVSPKIDEIFPVSTNVRVIAEPGRYLVAASCTLVASVTSVRNNAIGEDEEILGISDKVAAKGLDSLTRGEEREIVDSQSNPEHAVIGTIVEELQSYSKLYTSQNLVQQEVDVWTDKSDVGMLEAPDPSEVHDAFREQSHTAEGMSLGIIAECLEEVDRPRSMSMSSLNHSRSRSNSIETSKGVTGLEEDFMNSVLSIAAAGEAAVSGVVIQAVADSAPYQDDFAYYLNDGVYGAFNNLMFDHASVRPRLLRNTPSKSHRVVVVSDESQQQFCLEDTDDDEDINHNGKNNDLFSSTIFGPTCDSIDVISRSVLLPKLAIGDWLYFQNMGAYTCAAASDFNGFTPTNKFYVCSMQPEEFEIDGQ
mmetsp:Transcript_7673/g.11281  ORF Transcript_7673/g.11281 Transcript_7673/m.11281 type:complete len:765 (-) Transcript_7673:232-2526(-)|eukprot:CAMPEP_0196815996 /NCGR_PEP_ID=MMETSP1362-20130617/52995_1 /TAXON_ID=163516 /ORGANISM="Leptocylindrus danicus, Strain CCMP1856" /LENGTH=764 /DNA_ID=CAMNT_0042193169 /DNA_START=143 /DNA_END=2437 /DNA_ORIENTATION=-